jgi:hypothetical protein
MKGHLEVEIVSLVPFSTIPRGETVSAAFRYSSPRAAASASAVRFLIRSELMSTITPFGPAE